MSRVVGGGGGGGGGGNNNNMSTGLRSSDRRAQAGCMAYPCTRLLTTAHVKPAAKAESGDHIRTGAGVCVEL